MHAPPRDLLTAMRSRVTAAVSSGCIRMTNNDVIYSRVKVGTKAVVLK